MKIIPLYTVWNVNIKMKDIYMTFFLFFIYLFWIHINNITLKNIYDETKEVIKGKKLFPIMSIIYKITDKFNL